MRIFKGRYEHDKCTLDSYNIGFPFGSITLMIGGTFRYNQEQVFKIEVFNALRTRFGTSKYTSLSKQPFNMQSQIEMKMSLEVHDMSCPSSTAHTKIDQSMLKLLVNVGL